MVCCWGGGLEALVVVEYLWWAGHAAYLGLELWLHVCWFDAGLLLEDGAAHGGGEGEDQPHQPDLKGRVGPGDLLEGSPLVQLVHNQGDQHHTCTTTHSQVPLLYYWKRREITRHYTDYRQGMGWHFMTEFNVSDPDLYWIPPIRIQWSSESRIQIQELKRVKKTWHQTWSF